MYSLSTVEDIAALRESVDMECKLAAGLDGQGKLPEDFWETYSAFANTQGGVIILGLREKQRVFSIQGIPQPERLITDLFNNLNNPQKVSTNLLTDQDVRTEEVDGKKILIVEVPRATRKQRPVYINNNPLRNTFRRLQEGDRRCDDETVKRMLAEQVEDSRDTRVLRNYGSDDVDWDSFRVYRQMLRDNRPDHAWLDLPDWALLNKLSGWRKDRETGETGLTLAGLLMFGRWESLQEALPNYFVDYQEQTLPNDLQRWSDRLVPDGTWSGNLFDFYRRVYRKLIVDMKVPFILENGVRRDDTPIHKAIREALANTLVHADYTGRSSIRVIKQPDMFAFRNPGNMRVPVEQALQGGESDCRNRTLHQLFLMIGIGERAGSGIPTILHGWQQGNWRPPVLFEKDEPEQTVLELRMLDLLPSSVLDLLHRIFGDEFIGLSDLQKLILSTAFIESVVSHARIKEITSVHPYDLSKALQELVKKEFLESVGRGRSTQYYLRGFDFPSPDDVFAGRKISIPVALDFPLSSGGSGPSSGGLELTSGGSGPSSGGLELTSGGSGSSSEEFEIKEDIPSDDQARDQYGRLISKYFKHPVVDRLENLAPDFLASLQNIALAPRQKPYLKKHRMREVILALCKDQYVTLQAMAQLVSRNTDTLRQEHLSTLVREGIIWLAFPQTPTHEKQAYIAAKSTTSTSVNL